MKGRECGTCMACCTYLEIEMVGSGARKPCKFSKKDACGSCSIYDGRPSVCRDFSCVWLDGYGNDSSRPDKSGILAEFIEGSGKATNVKLLWRGAEDELLGRDAINSISMDTDRPLLVRDYATLKVIEIVGRGI